MSEFTRRDFARLLALSGPAALLGRVRSAEATPVPPLASTPQEPDERFWADVRAQFLLPDDLGFLNAANLCPASRPVVESLEQWTRQLESDPSPVTRDRLPAAREVTRTAVAEFLGVAPEEVVLTRNTSEANNLVSSGLALGPGDEVVVFAENHPSALGAWQVKGGRFGFGVTVLSQPTPHPGADYYVDAAARAITARTRVLAFSHVTNTSGDLLPAAELCALARSREVLTLVDGAQTFGALAVRPAEMGADFYTGSMHKWPCGPKETGLLYVRGGLEDRLHPSIVSLYPGRVGASRTLEAFGQRDEPALAAAAAAIGLQRRIGRDTIERRSRSLAQQIADGLRGIDGVTVWTHPDPARSAAVVSCRPGDLPAARVARTLYERDRIVAAAFESDGRPILRFSPHVYNLASEAERAVAAVHRIMRSGV